MRNVARFLIKKRQEVGGLAAVLGLSFLLRLPGLFNELWLDEVWSLTSVRQLTSWIGVFTTLRTDNNHHLNSLWLYLAGPDAPSGWYRAPSFASGLGIVLVGFLIARRDSKLRAMTTALWLALSFPLVYYSSEARGYAPAVFCALSAWYCLSTAITADRWRSSAPFWFWCFAGILFHQTFVEFFVAALVWSDTHAQRATGSLKLATSRVIRAFAIPSVAYVVLYLFVLRGNEIAGGPRAGVATIATETLSLLASGPNYGAGSWTAAALVASAFFVSLILMYRRGDDRWLFYIICCVLTPGAFALALPSAIYVRYFLIPGAFLLLALAHVTATALEKRGVARMLAIGAVAAVCAGTILHARVLLAVGRGRFETAVSRMASSAPQVTVASAADYTLHDFRTGMLVEHYARRSNLARAVHYIDANHYPASGTEWLIRERLDSDPPSPDLISDGYGNRYALDRVYRASPLAGFSWAAYRRIPSSLPSVSPKR
jgi:hypothetical protein